MRYDRDIFDAVKLQLSRLNSMWSPSGDTFCSRADWVIRSAVWDDRNPEAAVANLFQASDLLARQYMTWNDAAHDMNSAEWNRIYAAATGMLVQLGHLVKHNSSRGLA